MLRQLTLAMILMLTLAGCTQGGAGSVTARPALENTKWKLTEMGSVGAEMPELTEVEINLEFDDQGRAGGNSGCNRYGGAYQLDGDTIKFGEMMSTMMACEETRMQLEQNYLAALRSAGRIEFGQDSLTIHYGDGGARLVFARQ